MPRIILLLRAGVAALLVASVIQCGEFRPPAINGCKLNDSIGDWGEYGSNSDFEISLIFNPYEDHETIGCPIAIVTPGERVDAGSTLYDFSFADPSVKIARKASLEFKNSGGSLLFSREFFSYYFDTNVRAYDLYGYYPAATRLHALSDYDYMDLYLICNCSMVQKLDAYAELRLDYGADGGLRFAIRGSDIPLSGSASSWSAISGSGGYPHDYRWYVDGTFVGAGARYGTTVGSQDFNLRADLTDVYGRTATQTIHVDVDGIHTSFTGPRTVYLSEGGGVWSAAAEGGHPPYAFDWYIDGVLAGSGDSWSGYTGEGFHELSVRAHDSQGAVQWTRTQVDGIGNDACAPGSGADLCVSP